MQTRQLDTMNDRREKDEHNSVEQKFRSPTKDVSIRPRRLQEAVSDAYEQRERYAPAPIVFPSGDQAQAVIFVLPPRSFDLTTMTDFDARLFAMSQILQRRVSVKDEGEERLDKPKC